MFGHSDTPQDMFEKIIKSVLGFHGEYGINTFITGGYGSFDRLAEKAVLTLKKTHPDIKYYRLLHYHPEERKTEFFKEWDGTVYPEGMETVPRRYAIVRANRKMIDLSDGVICFSWHIGNSRELYEYALRQQKKRGLMVLNISEK